MYTTISGKTWYENIKNNKQKYEKQYPIPMWELLFLFFDHFIKVLVH